MCYAQVYLIYMHLIRLVYCDLVAQFVLKLFKGFICAFYICCILTLRYVKLFLKEQLTNNMSLNIN